MNRCSDNSIKNALELQRLMRTCNDISILLLICIILTTLKLYSHIMTLVRVGRVKDYVIFLSCDENLISLGINPMAKIKARGKISHTPNIYIFINKNFITFTLKFYLTVLVSGLMRKKIVF